MISACLSSSLNKEGLCGTAQVVVGHSSCLAQFFGERELDTCALKGEVSLEMHRICCHVSLLLVYFEQKKCTMLPTVNGNLRRVFVQTELLGVAEKSGSHMMETTDGRNSVTRDIHES